MGPSISDTLLLISRLILNVKKNLTYSESVDQAHQCQMAFVKIDHCAVTGEAYFQKRLSKFAPECPLVKIFLFSD